MSRNQADSDCPETISRLETVGRLSSAGALSPERKAIAEPSTWIRGDGLKTAHKKSGAVCY